MNKRSTGSEPLRKQFQRELYPDGQFDEEGYPIISCPECNWTASMIDFDIMGACPEYVFCCGCQVELNPDTLELHNPNTCLHCLPDEVFDPFS